MKKSLYLLLVCVLCGAFVFTACSKESQDQSDESTATEVTQTDIEENIVGSWIIDDRDGQHALTNEKCVITFTSPTTAYMNASFDSLEGSNAYWGDSQEMEVVIDGNKVTLTRNVNEHITIVNELIISEIADTEQSGSMVVKKIKDGNESKIIEEDIHLTKVDADYSEDIIGTWEGRCTSEGSIYDDGQDHRWEYKDDGTYVYYVKDGDSWVPSDNELNEYFVAGNLLCTRWIEKGKENREWWEISIDGDKMNWTALREGEDGKTFTASFEMTKVKE